MAQDSARIKQERSGQKDHAGSQLGSHSGSTPRQGRLSVSILSFGYKNGPPPKANMLFDVRFLQNPFWIEELRPQTGREKPVQDFVFNQPLAQEFLAGCLALLTRVLPPMVDQNVEAFTIAFGCTGGQHRSASIAEGLGKQLQERFPNYMIRICHRELDSPCTISEDFPEPTFDTDSMK